jgi:acyl-coenzyme A synthetase/AMP-(fatty) acid ligase
MVSFGATLSEALRERATARLATTLYDNYGSREAGFVARILVPDSGGIGIVSPRAQVDVVDEQGRSLPPGQLGLLRIKTPFMHTEYIDNPEASREFFKDGWSQPGDLAILHGPGRIQLMGRVGDLLLIGGAKVPPNILEELALRIVNAKDAGVCAIANQDGIEEIWIALAGAESDAAALKARLEPSLRPLLQFAVFHVATLAQIPRNAGGKVQRDQLKRAVAEIAMARPPR